MADDLKEAQRRYQEAIEATADQRRQIEEDLAFSDPANPDQWEADIKQARLSDPGGARPCLVHDQLSQYTAQVTGQIEKSPPALHAIPVGGGADKKAAEQIDGRFRHIEHASRATQHYARALTSAARAGVGYLIVRPVVFDEGMGWQEPRISSAFDPLKVVLDPSSVETDGSDASFGYFLTELSEREFERRWPKKKKRSFGDDKAPDTSRKTVLVAEEWCKVDKQEVVARWIDADGQESAGTQEDYEAASTAAGTALDIVGAEKKKIQVIQWRVMSGDDILEEPKGPNGEVGYYPSSSIGIVPVYGYIAERKGKLIYCGIPRRARQAQQAYNYHISEQLAYNLAAPKSPWWVSKRAAKGVEPLLDRMSVDARAWVPYNDMDADGPINAPSRISPSISLTNHIEGAAQALRDIQASIGMYQANLGAPSNETSGVAIESRKEQGESSTAHFPSHMAASLGHVGRIVMEMDAKLADTRRTAPILGVDGTSGSITVDPKSPKAFARTREGVTINPKIGQYAVRVVVGASYSTQRTQTNAAFAEIMRGNKELAAVVAPFWAQTLDFPGSDKFAQAMAAMAPEPVKAILQPEGQEDEVDPAMLTQQIEQLKQALQEALQHAQEAQQGADQAASEVQDKTLEGEKAQAEIAMSEKELRLKNRELDIKEHEAETRRLQVTGANEAQIQAVVQQLIADMGIQAPAVNMQAEMQAPAYEPASEEPEEPEGPSPELMQIMAGQEQLAQGLAALAQAVQAPRVRVPVRDQTGAIQHVIDRPEV